MADAKKELEIVISARDEASKALKSIGQRFSSLAKDARAGSALILGSLTLLGKGAFAAGADFQRARLSFETMLGSADKARKLLTEVADFAAKTPFDLPQVLEGSKQLLAMGTSAEELLPELKALGDVSAGLNVPMNRLIVNFGQVRTAGKLTGRELRDFNVAGVPLIEELTKVLNEQGGILTTIGGTSAKTKKKMDSLNLSIAKQTNRFDELKEKGKEGTATFKNLNLSLEANKKKLVDLGPVTKSYSQRVKVTKANIAEMVSEGEIGFDAVKKAFMNMTGEGGRFENLMDKLSTTVPGRIENIKDNFIRLGAAIVGVSTSGEILEGGLFDILSKGLEKLLQFLDKVVPKVQGFVQAFLENTPALSAAIGILLGLLIPLAIAFWGLISPVLVFIAAGAAIGFIIGLIIQRFQEWLPVITETWNRVKEFFINLPEFIKEKIDQVVTFFSELPEKIGAFLEELFLEKIPFTVGFAIGWLGVKIPEMIASVLAWFEQLPEKVFVILKKFVQVIINRFMEGWNWIKTEVPTWPGKIFDFLKTIPGKIEQILKEMINKYISKLNEAWNIVKGFADNVVGAFDRIVDAVRRTVNALKRGIRAGAASGVSGTFQHGGFVPGGAGDAVPAILHGGERVVPRTGTDVNAPGGGRGGGVTINLTIEGDVNSMETLDAIIDGVRSALGRDNELAAKGVAI